MSVTYKVARKAYNDNAKLMINTGEDKGFTGRVVEMQVMFGEDWVTLSTGTARRQAPLDQLDAMPLDDVRCATDLEGNSVMAFAPTYRGTAAKLEAEKPQVNAWFQTFVDALDLTDAQREVVDTGHCWRYNTDRCRAGYEWSRSVEHSDYFHQFSGGKKINGTYGDVKIVVRKNGSINIEALENATKCWADQRIHENSKRDISVTNRATYERMQSPGKRNPYVTIQMSQYTVGLAKVIYNTHRGFRVLRTKIKIEEITAFVAECDAAEQTLKGWE